MRYEWQIRLTDFAHVRWKECDMSNEKVRELYRFCMEESGCAAFECSACRVGAAEGAASSGRI